MISDQGLSKRHREVAAFRGFDFEVARGEIPGFLFPCGAGKSTMLEIITCFVRKE